MLGPNGFGSIKLGMSRDAAVATGQLTNSRLIGAAGCYAYSIIGGGDVVVSGNHGVIVIEAPARARTPEGIRAGSTLSEVKAAYPGVSPGVHGWGVSVPGSSKAHYVFQAKAEALDTDKINGIHLNLNTNDCTN